MDNLEPQDLEEMTALPVNRLPLAQPTTLHAFLARPDQPVHPVQMDPLGQPDQTVNLDQPEIKAAMDHQAQLVPPVMPDLTGSRVVMANQDQQDKMENAKRILPAPRDPMDHRAQPVIRVPMVNQAQPVIQAQQVAPGQLVNRVNPAAMVNQALRVVLACQAMMRHIARAPLDRLCSSLVIAYKEEQWKNDERFDQIYNPNTPTPFFYIPLHVFFFITPHPLWCYI
jgi:hypothetical protein